MMTYSAFLIRLLGAWVGGFMVLMIARGVLRFSGWRCALLAVACVLAIETTAIAQHIGIAQAAANTSTGNQTFTCAQSIGTPQAAMFILTRASIIDTTWRAWE